MKLAFISDLHLSPDTVDNNQLFYSLLTKWQSELDGLYILGDMFDYWLGDDDQNEFTKGIEAALKAFSDKIPTYFIVGNHDFGIGKKFGKRTGVTVLPDCSTITVNNDRILLSHGDVFCTLDKDYQKLKKIVTNPILKAVVRRTPLSWRYKIKNTFQKEASKAYNKHPDHVYYVVDDTILKLAKLANANIVIHGHTHHPGKYKIEQNNQTIDRYEIPDWTDRKPGGYILLEDQQITIHTN